MFERLKKELRSWFQYPNDDGFWYHLRIAQQVSRQGHRQSWDYLSYAPEGRRADSYPPMIHYLLGIWLVITRYLKIKLSDTWKAALLGIIFYIILGIQIYLGNPFPKQPLLLLLILLTTPVVLLRLNWFALRGEILVVPFLPLVMVCLNKPVTILWASVLFLLFLFLLSASKTSLTVLEFGIINTLVMAAFYQRFLLLVYLIPMLGAFGFFYLYCRRKKSPLLFPAILQWRLWKATPIKRSRFPHFKGVFIISEEEMKPTIPVLLYLVPTVIPALPALILAPNSSWLISWKLLFIYYIIRLGMGKRYLFFLAVPAAALSGYWLTSYPVVTLIILLWQMMNLLQFRRRDLSGIYKALQWIKQNWQGPPPLVVAWWNYGHIISGFGGFPNLWDSYYPDQKKFLEKETIFDQIVAGTPEGREFCRKNKAKFLLLDTFRVKPETSVYPLCLNIDGFNVYYLGGQNDNRKIDYEAAV